MHKKKQLTSSEMNILWMANRYPNWKVSGAVLRSARNLEKKKKLVKIKKDNVVSLTDEGRTVLNTSKIMYVIR
jgi:hypothetical protein